MAMWVIEGKRNPVLPSWCVNSLLNADDEEYLSNPRLVLNLLIRPKPVTEKWGSSLQLQAILHSDGISEYINERLEYHRK